MRKRMFVFSVTDLIDGGYKLAISRSESKDAGMSNYCSSVVQCEQDILPWFAGEVDRALQPNLATCDSDADALVLEQWAAQAAARGAA